MKGAALLLLSLLYEFRHIPFTCLGHWNFQTEGHSHTITENTEMFWFFQ